MSTPQLTPKQPTLIYIFGGSGDLTQRKLIPALYNLFIDNYLPQKFAIIGVARNEFGIAAYKTHLKKGVQQFSRRKEDEKQTWSKFAQHLRYTQLDLTADKSYKQIAEEVENFRQEWNAEPTVIFYLSVAPQLAPVIAKKLDAAKLCEDPKRSRMVFEKPFGHDLESATALNKTLRKMFKEEQIYRIDHYLGKETVQNILALRFANALFEPIWNSHYIDHVQITAAETVSIEGRGSYYESSGALRDMVQNHVLQMLCMIAMEAPISFDADEIRNKKLDVLNAIRKWRPDEVHHNAVRGQYGDGWVEGKKVGGYRQEKAVAPDSGVETFAAAKFFVDNWRWKDVPFYVRTGKALNEKTTLITIQFKPAPDYAFPDEAAHTWRSNRLMLSIAPQMDIRLRFQAKQPGPHMALQPVDMVFNYSSAYGDNEPEAYETLLEDVIEGNATQFMRADQVEAAWRVIAPIMEVWQTKPPVDCPNYNPGSWGPEEAESLIARDGHHWVALPGGG
ncbi:MAG: glucose-6-phosphate dehydrogenase, partial [Flaviaesturariibacter sp.]|nr:glucose-6-phosphate dehydrogenase [Flaviaesturariibacter sp.]